MESKATIKDVAKYAGVSVATVSRFINDADHLSEKTAQKVRQAILATNYVPNVAARNLKTETSNIIAMLISDISNPHFTTMAKVIEKNLQKSGYSLLISSTDDDKDTEIEKLRHLRSLNIGGLILNTTGENDAEISALSHNLPIVCIDRSISSQDFVGDFAGSNGFDGIVHLTQYLLRNGHRKIGMISSNLITSTGRERHNGFVSAMADAGISVEADYPYYYQAKRSTEQSGIDGCHYLMSLEDRPSAIVVSNNEMAIGVYRYLFENDYKVPQDVSVVSFGNIIHSDLFKIKPTFVTLNPSFIGEKASELILSRIKNPSRPNKEVIFEPLLVENQSVARL